MAKEKPGSHEANIMQGAFKLLEKHIEDKHKNCGDCRRLSLQVLRAVTIFLESEGRPHVFPNNGIPIDTPETVAAKATKAKEALRIFGRKK
jgi:hypothetical protein